MSNDLEQIFGGEGFDTNSTPPAEDFEAIPPGKYPVLIEKAEVKQTKAGTGCYLELTLSVLDPEQFKNRKVWSRMNIRNPSQQAQEIGLRELAALGKALGLSAIRDTSELLNKVLVAHVKVKDGQNDVRTYSAMTPAGAPGVPQAPAKPQAPPQQQAPSAGSGKPPWMR